MARDYCAEVLRAEGFTVREEPFAYSSAPGRFATPAAGVVYLVVLSAAGHFGWRGQPGASLAVLLAGCLVLGGLAAGAMHTVLDFPWARRRSVNLTAARGEPALWLMAHLDSKSQPVPIGLRAAGISLMVIVMLAALTLSALQLVALGRPDLWPALAAVGALGAMPVAASVVGARSPGALDNASGVAAVLLTASMLPAGRPLGVVLTSAEELGLAGARAWARGRAAGAALNFDGLDDEGALRLWYSRGRPRELLRGLERACEASACRARAQSVPLGILVDGVALAGRGWEVVTLTKGSWRTVARIHTPRDSAARLEGKGIVEAARLAAALIETRA